MTAVPVWFTMGVMVVDRGRRLSIRIADEERVMLEALADRDGISASDFVRMFIRRAYAEAFGDKPPKVKGSTRAKRTA